MKNLQEVLCEIFEQTIDRIIISNKRSKSYDYNKIIVRQKLIKGVTSYQAERYTATQVFHLNLDLEGAVAYILEQAQTSFKQIDCYTSTYEYIIKCSNLENINVKRKALKEQKEVSLNHNREKSYLLREGMIVPPLIDLGVLTADGKIIKSRYDKFKQINRFIELIEDGIGNNYKSINIIDFGCGKSYLTFVLYYYLSVVKGIDAKIVGLDLKKDVISQCNLIAEKYGYSGLSFELGDINGYKADFKVDMVITLHACDTATDHAIYNAIKWNAKMIYSVPCCQHEFNKTIYSKELALLSRYGIVKERFAALSTDAIRAALLEAQGYRTQLLEFIDLSHSPKNILIRAIKQNAASTEGEKALFEADNFIKEFNVSSTLYKLLYDGLNPPN